MLFDQRGAGRSRPKGRPRAQYAAASDRGHGVDPREIRLRALDDGRRLLGRDAGAGLCAGASRTGSAASCCAPPSSAPAPNWKAHFSTRCRASIPISAMIFSSVLPPDERTQPLDAYWRRILDADPAVHGPAARAWHDTERILSEHAPGRVRLDPNSLNSTRALPATPFMEAHYFQNDCFMRPGQLLARSRKARWDPRPHRARPLRSAVSAGDLACAWRGVARLPRFAWSKAPAIRCTIPASGMP